MCNQREWEEQMQRTLESGSHTRRRTSRVLGGPVAEGGSIWSREDTRAVDGQGNVETFDRAWVARGVCGCVLTQKSGQVVCAECSRIVCTDHALECAYCHGQFCPAHAVVYGRGENSLGYCRHHRLVHYWRMWWGVEK